MILHDASVLLCEVSMRLIAVSRLEIVRGLSDVELAQDRTVSEAVRCLIAVARDIETFPVVLRYIRAVDQAVR